MAFCYTNSELATSVVLIKRLVGSVAQLQIQFVFNV